jgi:tRNA-2-methylthio-N6-dimethylallyladenosine synthase
MSHKLLETVAELSRVMPHIEVPPQAGDDDVLRRMKRGYTAQKYRELVGDIRGIIPDVAIHGDIIVGFPGETDEQFQRTYDLLDELRLDKIHLARYSARPGTVSARRMEDDVPEDVKRARFHAIDDLQRVVSLEKTEPYLGKVVEVLVESLHKDRWRGRTPQNKLVFFDDAADWKGKLAQVRITWAGPYSMSGELAERSRVTVGPEDSILLPLVG